MRDGTYPAARQQALALKEWLAKGGFYPTRYSRVEVDAYLANVLRRTTGIREGAP